MRWMLALFLVGSMAMSAEAQPVADQRPVPQDFFAKQYVAGLTGFGIGALGGAAASTLFIKDGDEGFHQLGTLLGGVIIGGVIGSSIVVYRYSNAAGFTSSYPLTLVGSVAGILGGPALFLTVPLGSVWGYNAVRKPR